MKEIKVQTCELFVKGMHCAACEILIEKKLSKHVGVREVKASLSRQNVQLVIEGSVEEIIPELNSYIKVHGYELTSHKLENSPINYKELSLGFSIAALFAIAFLVLQKAGLVNLLSAESVTLPFVLFIGVIASLSTCMAVVGGLVLSLSSTYAKNRDKVTPLVAFHASRLIGFFILGGVIGLIGSAFTLTPIFSFLLNYALFIVMVILGINLLEIFPFMKKLQLRMPKFGFASNSEDDLAANKFAPILLGLSTFFLPCGFTQSMQVYSLTTGSFINGALTMLAFALGTFPMLALISFASIKLADTLRSGIFFKTAGFIILFFAIINFIGALAAIGLIKPFLNI